MDAKTEIPTGKTKEEIQQREKIIKDFYANWIAVNQYFTWKQGENSILYHCNRKNDCTTRNKHAIVVQSFFRIQR